MPDKDGGRLSQWLDVREGSLALLMNEDASEGLKWKTFRLFPADVMKGDAFIALQAALRYVTVRSVRFDSSGLHGLLIRRSIRT